MNTTSVKIHICLVGNGRLARQLEAILINNSISFSHVFRSRHSTAEIDFSIKDASHVWLAISDQAIEPFYATYGQSCQNTWVHFSGALNTKYIFSAHPLMTFSNRLMSPEDFNTVHFVLSAPTEKSNENSATTLNKLMPGFTNQWSYIEADKKALYHALCVIAGNFPIILWSQVLDQFQKMNLPQAALHSYLDRTLMNFKNEGAGALTGPLVRGDTQTMKDNIQALDGDSLQLIYKAFVNTKGITL